MAYESNTVDTVIQSIKVTEKSEIRIIRICDEDGQIKAVDIRQWYCTANDPTMKPTQKGVRIKDESCPDLLLGIMKSCSSEALVDLMSLDSAIQIGVDELKR